MKFGEYLQNLRKDLKKKDPKWSLKRTAKKLGISAGYLSRLENNVVPPPSNELLAKISEIYGEDLDIMMAAAGRMSPDLVQIFREKPKVIAELLRAVRNAPESAVIRVVRQVRDGDW